jgi:tetratricopeptide (TPR) repeat protein
MYLKARTASNDEYMGMVNRFVATYPKSAEGYLRRAAPLIDLTRFDEADKDFQQYLSLVEDKASGHYNVASLIFDKLRLQPQPPYEKWTPDLVLRHVDEALSIIASRPASDDKKADETKYRVMKAQVLMFNEDYDGALAIYEALNSEVGGAPSYLYAISMAREGRGDSLAAVMEPIDSAIAMVGEPLPREASTYVIRRGHLKANAGKYREAVLDYNQYAYLLNSQVNATFYYERSQVEVNGRMYEQALSDIGKAIELAPREAVYQVEKAAIAIRVNMLDECIEACQAAIMLNPDIIDSYRILGYAQLQKGDKENARRNLQKAVDMGDEGAKQLIETYFK